MKAALSTRLLVPIAVGAGGSTPGPRQVLREKQQALAAAKTALSEHQSMMQRSMMDPAQSQRAERELARLQAQVAKLEADGHRAQGALILT